MDERLLQAEAVVFDVGNVLLHFDPEKACSLLAEDIRAPLQDAMFGPGYPWGAFDMGRESNETIAKRIAANAGLPHHWEAVIYILHHFHETMHALPMAGLIPSLKAMGKRLYALTNYPEPSFTLTCNAFPFFARLDGCIVSAREKLGKPDDEIFQLLIQRYQLNPEKSLFIDDLESNILAARQAGFNTWHYAGEDRIFS